MATYPEVVKIVLLVALIAVAVYVAVRVMQRRGGQSPAPRRPLGPDDDPDFLRGLDRRPDGD